MTNSQDISEPLLYTIDEAACILSMSGSTVRRSIKIGSLRTVHPSVGTVRISRAELDGL